MIGTLSHRIAPHARRLGRILGRGLTWLLALPWYALGVTAGLIVALVLWIVAALIAGYAAGRGT